MLEHNGRQRALPAEGVGADIAVSKSLEGTGELRDVVRWRCIAYGSMVSLFTAAENLRRKIKHGECRWKAPTVIGWRARTKRLLVRLSGV